MHELFKHIIIYPSISEVDWLLASFCFHYEVRLVSDILELQASNKPVALHQHANLWKQIATSLHA
jgi:hypothetical protein